MVIWVTGLSGAGKTTLCGALHRFLKPRVPEMVVLDGDIIRAAFGNDLGYHEEHRILQVRRLQGMAKVLSEQGLTVLVAVLYSNPGLLEWNRQNLKGYFEIYLESSLGALRQRDWKGLYAKADSGQMKHVVGLDVPWHAPQHPDMRINTDHFDDPEAMARRVFSAIPALAHHLISGAA